MIELAHPVDQAALLRLGRRPRLHRHALAGSLEELGEPAVRLEVAPDHHRVVRLERLRHPVDERPRKSQRHPDLADRRPCPIRHEIGDHPGVLRSVAAVDVLDDLLPARRREVDVDVRVGRPALVDEPLEEQVVLDRLDPADPEGVGHDRARGAAPALGRDPLRLGEPHQVPADQEELGEPGPLDHVELVGEPVDDSRGQRVIAPLRAIPAQPRQVRERRLARRHREAREAVLLEPEIDPAGRGELDRPLHPGRPCPRDVTPERAVAGRQGGHLGRRLQVRLAVRPAQVGQPVERPTVADGGQDVLELAALGQGVVDVVRHDDRQIQLAGQRHGLGHEPVVVGQVVVRQLEVEAVAGGPAVALRQDPCGGPRPVPIADPQPPRDLAVATARQGHEPVRVLGEQRVIEPGHGLRPGEVGPRHEPAQAPVADRITGEQDQVRAALRLADPATVLLDRLAMTGQTGPLRSRPIRLPVAGYGLTGSRDRPAERDPLDRPAPAAPPDRSARRHHHPIRIAADRVAQLHLDPEDGPQPRVLVGGLAADDAVEALVVGHREPAQTELGRPLGQLVRRRGTVEEREVGVAVELGIGGHVGPSMIERLFDLVNPSARPAAGPPKSPRKLFADSMKQNGLDPASTTTHEARLRHPRRRHAPDGVPGRVCPDPDLRPASGGVCPGGGPALTTYRPGLGA